MQTMGSQFNRVTAAWCGWWRRNGLRFAIVMAVAAAVHYQMYANGLQNPDSLWLGSDYHVADSWELSLGRWGLVLVDWLRGGLNSPIVSGLGMLLCYALGGLVLADVLGAQGKAARLLIPLAVVLAPATTTTESYLFCSIAYALAFFLAVLAVRCVQVLPPVWGSVAGAVSLMFALSMYQANIGVATGLCVMLLLLQLLQTPGDLPAVGKQALRLGGMGLGGVAAYYGMLQLLLALSHTQMADYKGAANVGVGYTLRMLPQSVPNAYKDFFSYFFTRDIATNAYTVRPIYAALLALAVLACLWQLYKNRAKPLACLLAVLCLAVLPLAVAFIDIVAPETTIIMLTASGLLTVVPFCLALCGVLGLPGLPHGAAALCTLLVVALLRGYVLTINTNSMVMLNSKEMTVSLAARIVADLEQNEDYRAGLPVMIVGKPEYGSYPNPTPYYYRADPLPQAGLFFNSRHANTAEWQHILRQYLGVAPAWCTEDQAWALTATEEFAAMPLYPEPGSIQTIDGVVVVKVAE